MPSVTVNLPSAGSPSLRTVADCAGSRLEAVEQQLDSTLERLVWRRRSASALQHGGAAAPTRRRRAVTSHPRLSLVGGPARP